MMAPSKNYDADYIEVDSDDEDDIVTDLDKVNPNSYKTLLIRGIKWLAVILVVVFITGGISREYYSKEIQPVPDGPMDSDRKQQVSPLAHSAFEKGQSVKKVNENGLDPQLLEEYKLSIEINASMDMKIDPCQNFYAYACGGWIRQNPIPSSYLNLTRWGIFPKTKWEINKWIQSTLEIPSSPMDSKPMQLAKIFFQACVSDKIDEREYSDQRFVVKSAAENVVDTIFDDVVKNYGNFTMARFLGSLRNSLGLNFGIKINVAPLTQTFVDKVRQFGIRVQNSDFEYNWLDTMTDDFMSSFPFSMLEDEPIDEGIGSNELIRTLGNETGLTNLNSWMFEDDDDDDYSEQSGINWSAHWTDYFKAAFNGVTDDLTHIVFQLEEEDTYALRSQAFHFNDRFDRTFWVGIVEKFFDDFETGFYSPIGKGLELKSFQNIPNLSLFSQGSAARAAEQCTLITKTSMAHAIDSEFVLQQFSPVLKAEALKMYQNILQAFKERVDESNLWSKDIKDYVKEKANAIKAYIGYPEWIVNQTAMDEYYEEFSLSTNMSYIEIRVKLLGFNSRHDLAKVVRISESMSEEWITPVTEVNAFNEQTLNSIYIPAGIIRLPFYGFPRQSLNYGSLGFTLGHEITHSFDNDGRWYGIHGNDYDWLENDSKSKFNFEREMECLENQVGNYYFEDIAKQADGNSTVGENIADNGGLAQAFRAYQNYIKMAGPEKPLFGLEFTPEQLFFISSAQGGYLARGGTRTAPPYFFSPQHCPKPSMSQCTTYSNEGLKDLIDNDPHSPAEIQTLQAVSNSKHFHSAFNCPLPVKRCEMW